MDVDVFDDLVAVLFDVGTEYVVTLVVGLEETALEADVEELVETDDLDEDAVFFALCVLVSLLTELFVLGVLLLAFVEEIPLFFRL